MNYRSVSTLNKDILEWLSVLPLDFDVVVGIPRSGLLVANLISLYRNLPLTDVDGLLQGKLMKAGRRCPESHQAHYLRQPRKILVVDDSMTSGRQLQAVKEKIRSANLAHDIRYGVVYIESKLKNQFDVDCYFTSLSWPRCFEWNLLHHKCLENACVDIDGVLCRDPKEEENDDGEKYRSFISHVQPRLIPTQTIGWLVTCRLEKYRPLTEEWLCKHGIQYNHLVMMDLPSKADRQAVGSYGAYKASVYRESEADLFIESSPSQARDITRLTGKPVLCAETMEMANLSAAQLTKRRMTQFVLKRILHPVRSARRFSVLLRGYLQKKYASQVPKLLKNQQI